jgi:predicted nucleic acid-binding protein
VLPSQVPAGPLSIDTDAFSFIHFAKGRHAEYSALIAGHPLAMAFPVVGELKVAGIRGNLGARRLQALESAIGACVVIPSEARVVERWAAMRSRLMSQLKGEGINDLWIAACCLVHDLPIVTGNLSDFGTIQQVEPTLQIVHPDL